MYHSVTFGNKNSWTDWHLIPSSRPVINPPPVRTNFIEVPGMDGAYDMTEWLTGRPNYQNRTGSLEFVVANDYTSWEVAYSTIMNYLHGKRMTLRLEDDPEYYYEGRFAVSQWKSDKWYSIIVINYTMDPWKKRNNSTAEPWRWDPFNFYTGVIQDFSAYPIEGTESVVIYGGAYPEAPKFTCSSPMTLTFKNNTYSLPAGETTFETIILDEGANTLTFSGNGVVGIDYRGGSL